MNKVDQENDHYHHGKLKEALITIGLEVLKTEGMNALSLRNIAAVAGVSKTAPYRHFQNREFFMVTLADEGFHQLLLEFNQINPHDKHILGSMGKVYLNFGRLNPELYRLMHSKILSTPNCPPMPWAKKAFDFLGSQLQSLNSTDVAAAWGYIHGVTLVCIDQLFPPYYPEPDWEKLAFDIEKFTPKNGDVY